MSKFEILNDEIEVLRLIDKLRIEDVKDEDITVIYKEGFKYSTFRYSGVHFKKSSGNLWDRLVSRLGDSTAENRVFSELDLSSDEREHYQTVVEDGQFLVFVSGFNTDSLNAPKEPESSVSEEQDKSEPVHIEPQPEDTKTITPEVAKAENTDAVTDSNSEDGVTVDMRSYVVSTHDIEPADNHDSESSTSDGESSDEAHSKDVRTVPENPDYKVKDNVVDLGNK